MLEIVEFMLSNFNAFPVPKPAEMGFRKIMGRLFLAQLNKGFFREDQKSLAYGSL
jgi:hypothetical protein